jgi:GDP-mannose 6-dehydrogenase
VGVLGFSFKAGTDDLRESPMVEVIEVLLGKGYKIKLYDNNVNVARLIGANKSYIEEHIPHIAELMCSKIEDAIAGSDVIIIGNKADEFKGALAKVDPKTIIVDLVRVDKDKRSEGNYIGLAW